MFPRIRIDNWELYPVAGPLLTSMTLAFFAREECCSPCLLFDSGFHFSQCTNGWPTHRCWYLPWLLRKHVFFKLPLILHCIDPGLGGWKFNFCHLKESTLCMLLLGLPPCNQKIGTENASILNNNNTKNHIVQSRIGSSRAAWQLSTFLLRRSISYSFSGRLPIASSSQSWQRSCLHMKQAMVSWQESNANAHM